MKSEGLKKAKKDWVGGKASVFKTLGASNHAEHERAWGDYYATEPKATEWLLKLEQFDGPILEPACGEGHISEVLTRGGYFVTSRDLIDRGYGEVADFLAIDNQEWNGDIVTNPPYAYAQEFVESHSVDAVLEQEPKKARKSRKKSEPKVISMQPAAQQELIAFT